MFIRADSVTPNWYDPQLLNRYSYVRNNPLVYIDPNGEELVRVLLLQSQKEWIELSNTGTMQKGFVVEKKFVPKLGKFFSSMKDKNIQVRVNSAFRTTKEQEELQKTNDRAANLSAHQAGLAIDFQVRMKGGKEWLDPSELKGVDIEGEVKASGMRWGADFNDPVHIDAGGRDDNIFGYENRTEAAITNQVDWVKSKAEGYTPHTFINTGEDEQK